MNPSLASSFTVQGTSSPWSSAGTVAPSWSKHRHRTAGGMLPSSSGGFVDLPINTAGTDFNAAIDSFGTATQDGNSVMPLARRYWQELDRGVGQLASTRATSRTGKIFLGFDLATPRYSYLLTIRHSTLLQRFSSV